MVVSIPEIIAVVCPDRYFDTGAENDHAHKTKLKTFKELISKHKNNPENKNSIEKALLDAIYEAQNKGLLGFENGRVKGVKSEANHKLIYDSPSETLEPIYFFILDLINDFGFYTEKLVDNFVSSPGSAHFGEIGQRTSILQQQGTKLMGDINTVMRSIINLVYDLREFKIRLESYEDLNSKDVDKANAAILSLKQVWMDKVDINKGNSSIKAMALGQGGFSTLLDAFLIAKDEKQIEKMDLNSMVKRILKTRISEFNHWVSYSKSELKKRFEIEKNYLKSQFNSLKLYINWAKPYLKSAQELQMDDRNRHPALVKMFNTMLLQLTLYAKRNFKDTWDDRLGELQMYPQSWPYKGSHKFYEVVFIDFEFRGIPQRTQQGFVSGGKTEISFRGYALNNEEINLFQKIFEKSELEDVFGLIEGATTDSIGQLTKDIDYFLYDKDEDKKEEKKKEGTPDQSNPFLALIGKYNTNKESAPKKTENKKENPHDLKIEKDYILPALQTTVKETTFNFFEIYKKVHGMPAFP